MADAPEIPEARDPFERRVAVSIAGMAVALAVVQNKGDNAKTDAIIKTNEASDQWARYQSKSIKGSLARVEKDLISTLQTSPDGKTKEKLDWLSGEIARYEDDGKDITTQANTAQQAATTQGGVNDRCDMGALALQIAVVMASVAILSRWKTLWWLAMVLALVGAGIGVSAFLL